MVFEAYLCNHRPARMSYTLRSRNHIKRAIGKKEKKKKKGGNSDLANELWWPA